MFAANGFPNNFFKDQFVLKIITQQKRDFLTRTSRIGLMKIHQGTMKAERKQNVIIVCNKDKDAHPRKMFNVQKILKFIP